MASPAGNAPLGVPRPAVLKEREGEVEEQDAGVGGGWGRGEEDAVEGERGFG